MVFDAVDDPQVGAGVGGLGGGELLAERGQGAAAAGRGGGVEAYVQLIVADVDVAGEGERFADQGAGFVVGARVVVVEHAGQDRFGVVGAHPDRVGDQLAFLVEQPRVGAYLTQG